MTDEPYTRVPNAILDNLARYTPAETVVLLALVRRITGWNKTSDVVSLTQLETTTGLSRRHIIDCLESLVTKCAIIRAPAKRSSYNYQLVNSVHQSTSELSSPVSGIECATSELSSPELVNSVHQLAPQLVNSVHTQKKESKEKKERSAPRKRGDASPRARDIVFEAVCEACGIDWHVCTTTQRQQANQTVETLRRAAGKHGVDDAGTADRIRHARRYWRSHDWRGKNGDSPTPAQLREIWGAAMKTYAPPVVAAPPSDPTPVLTGAALADYMRSRRNGADDSTVR